MLAALTAAFAAAFAAAELPRLTWYQATRHTYGDRFVSNGGSLERLRLILGHRRSAMVTWSGTSSATLGAPWSMSSSSQPRCSTFGGAAGLDAPPALSQILGRVTGPAAYPALHFSGRLERKSLDIRAVEHPSLVAGPVFKTGEVRREAFLASSIPVLYRQLFLSLLHLALSAAARLQMGYPQRYTEPHTCQSNTGCKAGGNLRSNSRC